MKKEAIFFILFTLILTGIISATTIPIYVRPLVGGSTTPNTVYSYVLNWTTSNNCSDYSSVIYSNSNLSITTGSDGTAFFNVTIPDNITSVPSYMCEYRDGSLRAVHQLSGQIFDRIYARSINLSDQIYTSGNVTGGGGFFSFLGTLLNPISSVFASQITSSGNITSAAYFVGDGRFLSGITASATPSGADTAIQYNNAGATGGNASAFWYNKTNHEVGINGSLVVNGVNWSAGHGAIIASSSNTNGTYVMYADGTMIEWIKEAVPSDQQNYIWTYPVAFASIPAIIGSLRSNAAYYGYHLATAPTTTGVSVQAPGANPSNRFDLQAIGRWTNLNLGTGSGGSGGIVNTITNSNGTCSQWANGVMECSGQILGVSLPVTSTSGADYSVAYPSTFTSVLGATATAWPLSTWTGYQMISSGGSGGLGSIGFHYQNTNTAQNFNIQYIAYGRWTNSTSVNTPDYSTWGLDSKGNIVQVNSSKNVSISSLLTVKDVNVTGTLYSNYPYLEVQNTPGTNTTLVVSTFTKVPLPVVISDTANAYNSTNYTYTIPITGTYISVLKARIPDGIAAGIEFGFDIGNGTDVVPDNTWLSTTSQSASKRNTLSTTVIKHYTKGQQIGAYVFSSGHDWSMSWDWTMQMLSAG